MNDFRLHVAGLRGELQKAVDRVLDSGRFILGEEVSAFEREFASFLGAEHVIGVGSGLDALELALTAAGIGPGDEVVTTPLSAFATTLAVLRTGATPVFAEIDVATCTLDPDLAERAVTSRTRALLPVHLYGQAADLGRLGVVAAERGLALIGDAAQAHGCRYGERDVAVCGTLTAYSFYPTKNLGALGDGGAVATADPLFAEHVRRARDYGQERRYVHTEEGRNSRLDELQAAILRVKLGHLAIHNRRRQEIALGYRERLQGLPLMLPLERSPGEHVYHQFVVRCARREALREHLAERGIQTDVHYPTVLPLQPVMARFGHAPGDFPLAERAAAEVVSLPIHPEMTDAAVEEVAGAIRVFFEKRG